MLEPTYGPCPFCGQYHGTACPGLPATVPSVERALARFLRENCPGHCHVDDGDCIFLELCQASGRLAEKFAERCAETAAEVKRWPQWKRDVLGKIPSGEAPDAE